MPITAVIRSLLLLFVLVSLAACSSMPVPDAASTEPPQPAEAEAPAQVAPPPPPPPPSASPAVIALLNSAESEASAGRLPSAIAAIERALRIEPKNPMLWQKLALLRLQKGDYKQAENFAARSNSWAGSNKALQARNWRIISEARSLRGDNAGAKAALARAKALEQ